MRDVCSARMKNMCIENERNMFGRVREGECERLLFDREEENERCVYCARKRMSGVCSDCSRERE